MTTTEIQQRIEEMKKDLSNGMWLKDDSIWLLSLYESTAARLEKAINELKEKPTKLR